MEKRHCYRIVTANKVAGRLCLHSFLFVILSIKGDLMCPLPIIHWTLLYMDPQLWPQPQSRFTGTPWPCAPLVLKFGDQHWRPDQTYSLDDIIVLTSGGSWSVYAWSASRWHVPKVLFVWPLIPLFLAYGDLCLGFKARGDPSLAFFVTYGRGNPHFTSTPQ